LWAKYLLPNAARQIIRILHQTSTDFSVVVDGVEFFNQIPKTRLDKISLVFWYDLGPLQISNLRGQLTGVSQIKIIVNPE